MKKHADRIGAAFAELMEAMHAALEDGYGVTVSGEEVRLSRLWKEARPVSTDVSLTIGLPADTEISAVTFRSKRGI